MLTLPLSSDGANQKVPHSSVSMFDFRRMYPNNSLMVEQKALGKPMWPGYFPLIEHNAVSFVKALYKKGENGRKQWRYILGSARYCH
jgi:hypothetical protein